ncbi:MAG: holin [Paludibacteraceae bacterium]|nr:holin [Paludibacteraceae bacterium]
MGNNIYNEKRIYKNTILLYFRMVLLMLISLYTSRVVLGILGVDDFGLYSVVGGVVVVLSFLNSSMSGATQRFLSYAIGQGSGNISEVFNTARVLHLFIAILFLFLSETLGLWFLNSYLNIPSGRLFAANVVYQFSILTFLITIISVPYNAAIVAYERMSAFAYISIIEASLKLFLVFMLKWIPFDKLIVYSILMTCISLVVRFIYSLYCRRHFEACSALSFHYNKSTMKEMVSFCGWTILGSLGSVSHTQGISVIINMFFGVAVNAAQGVANQVINAINNFVTKFMSALRPQIIKTYADNDLCSMHALVKKGCKIGICMVSFFSVPIFFETDFILNIWLEIVPDYTSIFIKIILLASICNAYSRPLEAAIAANGEIRNYQIIVTTLDWLHLPIAWIFFYFGSEPYYAMYVYLVLVNVIQICKIYMVCRKIQMSIRSFLYDVIKPCFCMLIVSFSLVCVIQHIIPRDTYGSIITMFLAVFIVVIVSYYVVMTSVERRRIVDFVYNKIKKR